MRTPFTLLFFCYITSLLGQQNIQKNFFMVSSMSNLTFDNVMLESNCKNTYRLPLGIGFGVSHIAQRKLTQYGIRNLGFSQIDKTKVIHDTINDISLPMGYEIYKGNIGFFYNELYFLPVKTSKRIQFIFGWQGSFDWGIMKEQNATTNYFPVSLSYTKIGLSAPLGLCVNRKKVKFLVNADIPLFFIQNTFYRIENPILPINLHLTNKWSNIFQYSYWNQLAVNLSMLF